MNTGWKTWFSLLGLASLYGLLIISNAQDAAEFNEALVTGAPQQTVVGLWQLRDLTVGVIYELVVLVVAVASVGVLLADSWGRRTLDSDAEWSPEPEAP